MVPFGVASAAAVRVGQASRPAGSARRDARGLDGYRYRRRFHGDRGGGVPGLPRALIALHRDRAVIEIGVGLLFVAAVFQLFDGLQGVATGALRGLGDTRTAMLWNLGGHWGIGLPLGYLLCFRWGYGVVGLWWGLSTGLIICGVGLLASRMRKGTRLASDEPGLGRLRA